MADIGRPTKYSKEIAEQICFDISSKALGLKQICNNELYPHPVTIYRWISENEDFRNMYARAKDSQADLLAEEILEIADDGSNDFMTIVKGDQSYTVENKELVNRSRLRIDARKWYAAKLRPNKYGDKIDVTTDGKTINQVQIFQLPSNKRDAD